MRSIINSIHGGNVNMQEVDHRKKFPKNIGIIFVEDSEIILSKRSQWNMFLEKIRVRKPRSRLDFDQLACAHLLLQINSIQDLFNFQILTPGIGNLKSIRLDGLPLDPNRMLSWFNGKINEINEMDNIMNWNIDYWIGITSKGIGQNYFLRIGKKEESPSDKIGMISSELWQRNYSPPSLFEYIAITVFTCGIYFINYEFNGSLKPHKTNGCIFDFTYYKPHHRILVSNPTICLYCKKKIEQLQVEIQKQTGIDIVLFDGIKEVISRKWMGSLKERDSPIYNLKKNYKYNVDLNSGFYKKPLEKAKENIKENSIIWLVSGLIGVVTLLLGNFLIILFNLKI